MRTRRAKLSDAPAIHALIAHYAAQGLLLPRDAEEIRANIGHFIVQEDTVSVVSCLSLESYGADLAEIRSIAVDPRKSRPRIRRAPDRLSPRRGSPPRHRPRFRRHARSTIFRTPGICRSRAPVAHRKNRA